jgi:hypothetical protein
MRRPRPRVTTRRPHGRAFAGEALRAPALPAAPPVPAPASPAPLGWRRFAGPAATSLRSPDRTRRPGPGAAGVAAAPCRAFGAGGRPASRPSVLPGARDGAGGAPASPRAPARSSAAPVPAALAALVAGAAAASAASLCVAWASGRFGGGLALALLAAVTGALGLFCARGR